ncbi:hypothetical protein NVP1155O_13 [Vibrio phage 1.155.O._10N.222.55.B3]|nr:hypothetical protein NVP1155O_13 [Vibrio phage 1.155.O._10N.222.55.B3]
MSVIKIATGRASVEINKKAYQFPHCVSWIINDPRENGLIASPQQLTNGIKTKNNLNAPASSAGVVREVPKELLKLLEKCFNDATDVRFTLFDIETGRQVVQDHSTIRQNPMNAAVAEGDENFNINLDFICAPNNQKHSFVEV